MMSKAVLCVLVAGAFACGDGSVRAPNDNLDDPSEQDDSGTAADGDGASADNPFGNAPDGESKPSLEKDDEDGSDFAKDDPSDNPSSDNDSDDDTDASDDDADDKKKSDPISKTDPPDEPDDEPDTEEPIVSDDACEGTPCGGDMTGEWAIVDSCVVGSAEGESGPVGNCDGGWTEIDSFALSGTVQFGEDGSFAESELEGELGMTFLAPLDCLGALTCADLWGVLLAFDATSDCDLVTDGCLCSVTLLGGDVTLFAKEGSWATDEETLAILDNDGNHAMTLDYCTDGDAAWLQEIGSSGLSFSYRAERLE